MKRLVLTMAALAALWVGTLSAQGLPRVYVTVKGADASGFTDPGSKDRATMLKELTGQLRDKKKTLQLVESADQADVTVEITKAGIGVGTSTTSTAIPYTRTAETHADKAWQATATLHAGEYQTEFAGEGLYTVMVAKQIASGVEKWVKDNQAEIARRRTP